MPLLLFCLTHLFVLFIMFKHLYIFIYAQIYEIKVLERRKCYETNLPTQEKTKKQSSRLPWKNVHKIRQKRSQETSQSRQKETLRITLYAKAIQAEKESGVCLRIPKGRQVVCSWLIAFERKIERRIEDRLVRIQESGKCRHEKSRQAIDKRRA